MMGPLYRCEEICRADLVERLSICDISISQMQQSAQSFVLLATEPSGGRVWISHGLRGVGGIASMTVLVVPERRWFGFLPPTKETVTLFNKVVQVLRDIATDLEEL